MIRNILFIVAFLSLLTASCSGRKNKAEHKNIIPEKDFISILTDLHIADGLLSLPEIRYLFSKHDSIMTYIEILDKYGYNKELMDKTMRFYFIKRPKKLLRIYDKVIGRLSEVESGLEKEMPFVFVPKEINLWQGYDSYYSFSYTDTAWFEVPIELPGYYTLRFTITVFPDDQTFNPRTGIYFSHPDSISTARRDYLPQIAFIKDGRRHTYSIIRLISGSPLPSLNGWFIDFEDQSPDLHRHYRIDKISLKLGYHLD